MSADNVPSLTPAAANVLRQLFMDGAHPEVDLLSKEGVEELLQLGLIDRHMLWVWINFSGMLYVINAMGYDQEKGKPLTWFEDTEESS